MLIVTATTVEEVTLVMNDGTVTVKSNPPFHQAMLLLLEMNHLTSMEDKTIRNTVYVIVCCIVFCTLCILSILYIDI